MSNIFFPLAGGFISTVVCLPFLIKYLRDRNEGQQIREEGPKWHEKKSGTPTMGGIVFDLTIVVVATIIALTQNIADKSLIVMILGLLGYGIIGFIDDSIGILLHRNLGLRAYQKLLGQILIAIVIIYILYTDQFTFSLYIPFFGEVESIWLYAVFAMFWLVGFSNAVNLSDGIDGLCSGLSIIAYLAYAFIAYRQDNQTVMIFALTVVGALLGFLIFNHKPAKIFMGDVGSLALGGGLAVISILLDRPWSLLLIGIVFVLETLSVILQVASFKTTGKRIFKMTPIHHHFEMSGFNEWQVDFLFWGTGLVGALVYLIFFI